MQVTFHIKTKIWKLKWTQIYISKSLFSMHSCQLAKLPSYLRDNRVSTQSVCCLFRTPYIVGCQGLTIWSITFNTGHDCFHYTESQSFTHLVVRYAHFKQHKDHRVRACGFYNNSLVWKQMTTFSPLLLISAQLLNFFFLQNEFAAKYR